MLEERRRGSATLGSMSPDELLLQIHATDRAGHIGITGQLGRWCSAGGANMSWCQIPFDLALPCPSLLPQVLAEFRAMAASIQLLPARLNQNSCQKSDVPIRPNQSSYGQCSASRSGEGGSPVPPAHYSRTPPGFVRPCHAPDGRGAANMRPRGPSLISSRGRLGSGKSRRRSHWRRPRVRGRCGAERLVRISWSFRQAG